MRSLLLLALPTFVALACGGSTQEPNNGQGGVGATGGSGGAGATECPASVPENGSACTPPWTADTGFGPPFAHCSWGDDPRPECRTTALCGDDGAWLVSAPVAPSCQEPPLPPQCPASPPESGTTCADASLGCWYGDGTRCACSPCMGGSEYPICAPIDPPAWACQTPAADCPPTIPQAGERCTTPDASCGPSCELTVICTNGVWQWQQGNCPICASPDTPIATPAGDRPISELRVGDLVYSVDAGAIAVVPIRQVGSTPVSGHHVVRVELEDGGVLEISPGHPTADGRTFADVLTGAPLDAEHALRNAELVPYVHERTHDILPHSSTGTYFASGVLIGSTLFENQSDPL